MMDTKIAAAFDDLAAEARETVRLPPLVHIETAARRRRATNRIVGSTFAVVGVLMAATVAVSLAQKPTTRETAAPAAQSSTAPPSPTEAPAGTYRALIEAAAAEMPGRPIVVPRTLPPDYAMLNPYDYYPLRPGLPGIRLCVMPADATSVAGVCVGTDDDSPWTEIDVDGMRVIVATASPPESAAALEPWRRLGYTSNWRNVAWLDQKRPS